MSTHRNQIDSTSTRNRSAISNGSWRLEGVDSRSALGRRFRDLCVSFANDLGGDSTLNEPQRALIRQVAAVTVESEKLQASIVRGESVDPENLVRLNNLQARLVKHLNIKPKGKDTTPTLEDYLREKGKAA
jgi:hypothetical protein